MFNYAIVLFAIYFLGSSEGIAYWPTHLIACAFIMAHLGQVSKYYSFWILVLVTIIFAAQPRLSLEYLLISIGFYACSLSTWWQGLANKKRKNYLVMIFVMMFLLSQIHLVFHERGSLLLWLPVFLSLYFQEKKTSSNIAYLVTAIITAIGNKKTTLLAYLASLGAYMQTKYFYLVAILLTSSSFIFFDKIKHFFNKSLLARIHIWQSSCEGWLTKPFFGYGFGTFTMNFPAFRSHSEVFGAQNAQQVSHGHGLIPHYLFTQGLFGLVLIIILFYIVYQYAKPAFWPMILISIFDSPLSMFNQFLLAGLILSPYLSKDLEKNKINNNVVAKLVSYCRLEIKEFKLFKIIRVDSLLAYILALAIFIPSLTGHYFYDRNQLDLAIKYDSLHPLYHFMRGSSLLHQDSKESEKSFARAVGLAPNMSFFHGFLAASQLANLKLKDAQTEVAKALDRDGADPYWYIISAFAHYNDPERYKSDLDKALTIDPDLKEVLKDPNLTSLEYIGSRRVDARVTSFYRRGEKIFLPVPYIKE